MTKVKLALLGMLAVYAVSLAASAAASAATQGYWDCQKVGTSTGRWNNSHCTARGGTEEWATKGLTGTETKGIEGTSSISILAGTILGKAITIECLKDIIVKGKNSVLKAGGASEAEIVFRECKLFIEGKLSGVCTVPDITLKVNDQLIHNAKGEIEDEFTPTKAEEVFVEIKIEGAECALKGTFKVKGKQICEFPNASQSLVTHQIVCKPAGSTLTLGGAAASFTGEEHINVVGGPQWGAA
jgi:uncharacterized Zn ribbon protein